MHDYFKIPFKCTRWPTRGEQWVIHLLELVNGSNGLVHGQNLEIIDDFMSP